MKYLVNQGLYYFRPLWSLTLLSYRRGKKEKAKLKEEIPKKKTTSCTAEFCRHGVRSERDEYFTV